MTAVALRGLLSRKLRTILTMIAIVLGVAMISGTYVLTDTINSTFKQIFEQSNRSTDAVITGKQAVSSQFSLPPAIPARVLKTVQSTPGVAAAEGEIADTGQLVHPNGKLIGGVGGAPTLLFSLPEPRFRSTRTVQGHDPHGDELTVDQDTVKREHLHLGQRLGLVAAGRVQHFTLVGVLKFGSVGSIGGATLIEVDLHTAQRITHKLGKYDQISVAAAPGVSQATLVRRLKARLVPEFKGKLKIVTQEQSVTDQTNAIGNALNFLTIALLAFGGIAVFVGAFIIFNTFSITVAQRAREFALLRTLGATRAQVLRSVILEALVIGLVSSVLGLFGGIGLAKALNGLFKALNIDIPNSGTIVLTRTVVVALLVGTLVTLAASLMPAIRATRVPPIAALREGASLPRSRFSRWTPYVAAVLILAGVLFLSYGIFANVSSTSQRLILIGLGAVVLFLGVAMLSPQLVGPLANVIGWPIERLTNITGRLARENAVRNPSRTATTAAALMIGLALVGFVTIFAAELKQTANDAVSREVLGSFAIYSDQNVLIPAGVAVAARSVPGVQSVSSLKMDTGHLRGIGDVTTNGIQPRSLSKVYKFQWKQGSASTLTGMRPHDAIIDQNLADDHKLKVGSKLYVTTTVGKHDTFTVVGIYKTAQLLSTWSIPYLTMRRDWSLPKDQIVAVSTAPGANLNAVKQRLTRVLALNYPTAQVHSQQDIKDQSAKNVNQLLALIYVLLAMSLIVSLFGIINTLVLSVYERTREIGMLRAIGTTRKQVRWMIRWESVITAVIGAILGLFLGIVLAVLVTRGLQSQGIEYAFPLGQLLIWVVVAVVFGIVAAAFPARRAARLDVLQAVSYE